MATKTEKPCYFFLGETLKSVVCRLCKHDKSAHQKKDPKYTDFQDILRQQERRQESVMARRRMGARGATVSERYPDFEQPF